MFSMEGLTSVSGGSKLPLAANGPVDEGAEEELEKVYYTHCLLYTLSVLRVCFVFPPIACHKEEKITKRSYNSDWYV